jgi:chromosome segregation ATPase
MDKTKSLKVALEKLIAASNYIDTLGGVSKGYRMDIENLKAALEAKDEKANDELRRLHDLLGKANALARIRANKIDELEQRLTKTEAQLGEAVWNYGELKREQLANQQKTSGSPINTSTALEAKDEPVAFKIYKPTPPRGAIPNVRDAELPWVYDQDPSSGNVASMWVTPVQTLRSKS